MPEHLDEAIVEDWLGGLDSRNRFVAVLEGHQGGTGRTVKVQLQVGDSSELAEVIVYRCDFVQLWWNVAHLKEDVG